MEWLNYLLGMLTLVFAIASGIAGIFTAYFGSGKSRMVGGGLVLIGIIVFVLFLWGSGLLGMLGEAPFNFAGTIVNGISALVGAIIGALIALGIFLLAIMKA